MRKVAVRGTRLDLAVDNALFPMIGKLQHVITRQLADCFVADDLDHEINRAGLAVLPLLDLAPAACNSASDAIGAEAGGAAVGVG